MDTQEEIRREFLRATAEQEAEEDGEDGVLVRLPALFCTPSSYFLNTADYRTLFCIVYKAPRSTQPPSTMQPPGTVQHQAPRHQATPQHHVAPASRQLFHSGAEEQREERRWGRPWRAFSSPLTCKGLKYLIIFASFLKYYTFLVILF